MTPIPGGHVPKLTKIIVDKLGPDEAPYFQWDGDLAGFGVRVFPSGRKVFYADYRTRDGGRKRMSIGAYGKLTVEEARTEARVILAGALKGEDAALERKTKRKSLTLAELTDRYVAACERGLILGRGGVPKKPSTLSTDIGRIERHIKPLLGRRLVIDISRADVTKFMRDVTLGKTRASVKTAKLRGRAIVEGGAGTAARTVGLLGGILTFAVSEGIIGANPAHGVKRPASQVRQRRLTPSEYHQLGKYLDAAADVEAWQGIAAIKLLALSGCRRGEIEKLRKAEVLVADHALALSDTKTGASVRPLGRAALDLIEAMPANSSPYVLPSITDPAKPYGSLPNAIERTFARSGIPGVTAHTLRHSFASVGAELGFTDTTIGAILGHATGHTITSRYIHRLDAVLIAAADAIAAEVLHQMTTGRATRR